MKPLLSTQRIYTYDCTSLLHQALSDQVNMATILPKVAMFNVIRQTNLSKLMINFPVQWTMTWRV